MKLTNYEVVRQSGDVRCYVAFNVQGKDTSVEFTLTEHLLTNAANAHGRSTWDERDIAALGASLVGQEISI